MWKKLWIGNLIKYIEIVHRTTFCTNAKRMDGFASISWYFNDSKTGPIHCEGSRVLRVERFRESDGRYGYADTGSKASFDKRSGQERWDNERSRGERDRPPSFRIESSCCARELVPRTYILLEAWTRGSFYPTARGYFDRMKVKHRFFF